MTVVSRGWGVLEENSWQTPSKLNELELRYSVISVEGENESAFSGQSGMISVRTCSKPRVMTTQSLIGCCVPEGRKVMCSLSDVSSNPLIRQGRVSGGQRGPTDYDPGGRGVPGGGGQLGRGMRQTGAARGLHQCRQVQVSIVTSDNGGSWREHIRANMPTL